MAIERWSVGDFSITSVVEEQSDRVPPEAFLPTVTRADVASHSLGDENADEARVTRLRMLAAAAKRGALVLGTHFPNRPAGRVVEDGEVFRFVPLR
jgi:hypothetical protein